MIHINPNLFPGGRTAALTMSYDDGAVFDEQLIDIFNRYGIKGTFHVNDWSIGEGCNFTPEKARELYKGHELSVHSCDHPMFDHLNDIELYDQIVKNKEKIENICGYTVRGMSYPHGVFNERIMNVMRVAGMKYGRTTEKTLYTAIPEDFLAWHPSGHHKDNILDLYKLIESPKAQWGNPRLLYIWGHSHEFGHEGNWDLMEEFCKTAAGHDHIWYATNIEIYDYVTAARNLEISANRKTVFNPSYLSVWVTVEGSDVVEIKPGENKL